jgi:hypothetical protein
VLKIDRCTGVGETPPVSILNLFGPADEAVFLKPAKVMLFTENCPANAICQLFRRKNIVRIEQLARRQVKRYVNILQK